MKYLKLRNQSAVPVLKEFFTVGEGPDNDLNTRGSLSGSTVSHVLFSLHRRDDGYVLMSGDEKIRVNGVVVDGEIALLDCSRIEWPRGEVLFLEMAATAAPETAQEVLPKLISALATLSAEAKNPQEVEQSVSLLLGRLCEALDAESASLLCENQDGSEWTLVAAVGDGEGSQSSRDRQHSLISHTLLKQALEKSEPILIESIIGHALAQQQSIIMGRIFSCACIPLMVGGARPFGALFLATRSPSRAIKKEFLAAAQVIATHSALYLIASRTGQPALPPRPENSTSSLLYLPESSSPMPAVVERLTKLAPHDLSILIRGETGTGKEVIAREIHRQSPRANKTFVALNCAAIPATLLESLLFGHVKGAFTGATKDKEGKILQANGGTLFLDEIGDLSPELQTKLLRVLQEKEVEPVGSDVTVSVDIRILSATHQDLEEYVANGKFRKDLYYRLNGATISLPRLKSRGAAEITLLAQTFLNRLSPSLQFSEAALAVLCRHEWPGNVRELEQVVTRAVALCSNGIIEPRHLELEAPSREEATDVSGGSDLPDLKEAQKKLNAEQARKALIASGGNRLKAAKALGVSERTFYRILASTNRTEP